MFKGLKSKLEDEAKRLQATVAQYGENIAQQSDNGSEIGGYTRRLFDGSASEENKRKSSTEASATVTLPTDTIISLDDDDDPMTLPKSDISNALDDSDYFGDRVRRLSNASMESNESSFSTFTYPHSSSATAFRMDTISSDVESNAGSVVDSLPDNTPKEQLSSIFQKLQIRATNYKQKYRELVKAYQEVVRENEKCRTVLTTTQDKALQRINKMKAEKKELVERIKELEVGKDSASEDAAESKMQKLQSLLEKCRDRIASNKIQITSLMEENNALRARLSSSTDEHSSPTVEKVTAEWKGRVDRLEEEWSQRLASCDEKASIAIATSKAEMHAALQQKDSEVEKWINKCHMLEKQDADGNQRWQQKVDELNKLIVNLENEKADMVEKLSKAKQEGVKLVKEDEERKREKLSTEYNEKLTIELMKKDDEWRKKIKEVEEQMQLAIEERELQKTAAIASQEKKISEINDAMENIKTENIRLGSELEKVLSALRTETERAAKLLEEKTVLESGSESKQIDLNVLMKMIAEKEREIENMSEKCKNLREDKVELEQTHHADLAKIAKLTSLLNKEKHDQEVNTEASSHESAETQTAQLSEDVPRKVSKETEEALARLHEEMNKLRVEVDELKRENNDLKQQLNSIEKQKKTCEIRCDELELMYSSIAQRLSESESSVERLKNRLNEIISENEVVLKEKDADMAKLKEEYEFLPSENYKLKEQIVSLQKETSELVQKQTEEINSLSSRLTALDNEKRALMEKRDESDRYFKELSEQLKEMELLKKQLTELETENKDLSAKQSELIASINMHEAEIVKLREQLTELENKKKELGEQKAVVDNLCKSTSEQLTKSEEEVRQLQEQVEQLQLEKDLLTEELTIYVKEKTEEDDSRLQQNDMLINQLRTRELELSALYETTLKRLIESESNLNEMKGRVTALAEEKAKSESSFGTKIRELQEKISNFEQTAEENQLLMKRCNELEAVKEKSSASREIDHLKATNQTLIKRCEELEAFCDLSKPTETEYLRNILYRYMLERENLGREVVTIARVIGTVMKFDDEQLDAILKKEESRYNNHNWYAGNVIHTVQAVVSPNSNGVSSPNNHHYQQQRCGGSGGGNNNNKNR